MDVPSLCTMVALQWEPQIIAVAVMYLAGRLCKFDIQDWTSKQSSRRWWEQFVHDVPVEVLEGNRTIQIQFVVDMYMYCIMSFCHFSCSCPVSFASHFLSCSPPSQRYLPPDPGLVFSG